jgi:hypothetical protein
MITVVVDHFNENDKSTTTTISIKAQLSGKQEFILVI